VNAQPVTGTFRPTIPAFDQQVNRFALEVTRPPGLWLMGTELTLRAEAALRVPNDRQSGRTSESFTSGRGVLTANLERPFGDQRLVMATTAAGLLTGPREFFAIPPQELLYFGGPVSGPGYDYHSLVSRAGVSQHVEWRFPTPFIPFSLGRFGKVPARGSLAPFFNVVGVTNFTRFCEPTPVTALELPGCTASVGGFYPSAGAAFLSPFDLLRIQVARGFARGGRWTFNIDLSREFWSIL
jgi:hypothetical protein